MGLPLTWAEIDLRAIAHNVRALRQITDSKARLMAVVKANAYGHGVMEVTKTALKHGAELLGVARIHEGIQLREAGFDAPVLILGYTPSCYAESMVHFDLTPTISSYLQAKALSDAVCGIGKKIRIHLKVDTGMGRLGILPDSRRYIPTGKKSTTSALEEVAAIASLPGVELEGVYTHFATADSADKSYAIKQFEIFLDFLEKLRQIGIEPAVRHTANSAAIIDMPETHLDLVRAGISLYGLYPSGEVNKSRIELKPAMALKTRIAHLKKVPSGFKISYGITYETKTPTTVATVPIGYADGLNRLLSSRGKMLVYGLRAPIIGRVCMDQTMLDVGHIPDVQLDQEVVVFGEQGNDCISIEEMASELNTINYEIVCSITNRVPRVYLR
ncbi:MAG: alanine racemase [Deltaproteobacteria bacterium]|nr:alanine racemase [Deltaproteobacteria bacterium]